MNTPRKFNVQISLCLMMIGFMSVVEATVPPIPKGIFSMPAAEPNGFPDQILNDPRIVGLDLGGNWADFESQQKAYMIGRLWTVNLPKRRLMERKFFFE